MRGQGLARGDHRSWRLRVLPAQLLRSSDSLASHPVPRPNSYPWTEERLLAVPPRDPSTQAPKPPRQLCVTYPFSTDDQLREHVGAAIYWLVGWSVD